MKLVAFRRYYRSVRHYAVRRYTPIELLLKESRCSISVFWRICYNIYERVVMTKPPVEHHSNMPREEEPIEAVEQVKEFRVSFTFTFLPIFFSLLQTDKTLKSTKSRKHVKKNSLNEIDDDSSDGDLSTKELLDKYETVKDSSADADYMPSSSSEELSSDEVMTEADTEEEKTESQKQLNGEPEEMSFQR